jgi:hypothetical protein
MSKQKIHTTIYAFIAIVLVSAIIRYLNVSQFKNSEFSHFSPLAAMCIFTGGYFNNYWKAILFSTLTMLVSDLLIHQFVYNGEYGILYSGWYKTYILFALITLLSRWMLKNVTVSKVVATSIISVVGHWLLMDFMVWIGGGTDARTNFTTPLTKDWAGLQQCYIQGIPFMRNLLISTIAYSSVMFGLYEFITQRNTNHKAVNA